MLLFLYIFKNFPEQSKRVCLRKLKNDYSVTISILDLTFSPDSILANIMKRGSCMNIAIILAGGADINAKSVFLCRKVFL